MQLFTKVRSLLRNLFSWRRVEKDLYEEVHSHLEMLTEENLRAGMGRNEAERAARIELGGIEQVKEEVREQRIGNWIHSVLCDCRFALRQLRKAPGFTAIAVLTLALGIGANAALFAVVESVVLRALPYTHADRLTKGKDLAHRPSARVTAVSGDYASTLGAPLLRGRMVNDDDTASAPPVVAVNESLAKKYFGNMDPLQQQIILGGKETGMEEALTVVGVLGDQVDSKVGGIPDPMIFIPYQQVPTTSLFYQALLTTMVNFVVKTRGDLAVVSAMRTAFHEAAPSLALDNFKTMQQVVDENIFSQRMGLYLTGTFAGLAVLMVVAGLYGVLAQLVSYRRHEIGIRMALGATRQSVAQMILGHGAVLIAAGLGAGILLALAMGQLVSSFLYALRPTDFWTYIGVAISLLAVGLLASVLPARRAASIEPMQALREE
jgi:MacB-like periplasmic core domain/FtsX-like permease family